MTRREQIGIGVFSTSLGLLAIALAVLIVTADWLGGSGWWALASLLAGLALLTSAYQVLRHGRAWGKTGHDP
jgi:hypothetical protein